MARVLRIVDWPTFETLLSGPGTRFACLLCTLQTRYPKLYKSGKLQNPVTANITYQLQTCLIRDAGAREA